MYDDYKIMRQKEFDKLAKEYKNVFEKGEICNNNIDILSQSNSDSLIQKKEIGNSENLNKKNN